MSSVGLFDAVGFANQVSKTIEQLTRAVHGRVLTAEESKSLEYGTKFQAVETSLHAFKGSVLKALSLMGGDHSGGQLDALLDSANKAGRAASLRFKGSWNWLAETKIVTQEKSEQWVSSLGRRDYVLTDVTRYHGYVTSEWDLIGFVGNDVEHAVRLGGRTSREKVSYPYSMKNAITPNPWEVNISWLKTGSCTIDRVKCKTPFRNAELDEALAFATQLKTWCAATLKHFEQCSVDRAVNMLNPVIPLFVEGEEAAGRRQLSVSQLLSEHQRSVTGLLQEFVKEIPLDGSAERFYGPQEVHLLFMSAHIKKLCEALQQAQKSLESILRQELISVIGKEISGRDFDAYMQYHCRRSFPETQRPKSFCYAIQRPNYDPEGIISIECGGDGLEELETFVHESGSRDMSFKLDASTTVQMRAKCRLHGFMSHQFGAGGVMQSLRLALRARQFSCFIVLIGRLLTPTQFDPNFAALVLNKEALEIPLDAVMIPSAQEFQDAIKSLSDEQQRFAKLFRAMQLSSTLFGVCVIQIKPQLEKLLRMAPDSLTKEIPLTQDLLRLFAEFQIPSDLLSCTVASLDVPSSVTAVRANVAAMFDMIGVTSGVAVKRAGQSLQDILAQVNAERKGLREPYLSNVVIPESTGPSDEDTECLILDFGSVISKVGYEYSDYIRGVFSTEVGRPRHMGVMVGMGQKDSYAGEGGPASSNALGNAGGDAGGGGGDDGGGASGDSTSSSSSSTGASSSVAVPFKDYTSVPSTLEALYEKLVVRGSVRPIILSPGAQWTRSSPRSLGSDEILETVMPATAQKSEKNLCFDLLDALSQSGGISLDHVDLHVVVGCAHVFEATLIDTLVHNNVNPIEQVERSISVLERVIHE